MSVDFCCEAHYLHEVQHCLLAFAGYSPAAKIRTPCALQASLQIFGRRMRIYIPRLRGIGRIGLLPQLTQKPPLIKKMVKGGYKLFIKVLRQKIFQMIIVPAKHSEFFIVYCYVYFDFFLSDVLLIKSHISRVFDFITIGCCFALFIKS